MTRRNPIVPGDIQYIPNHEATCRLPCPIRSYGTTNYRRVADVDRQLQKASGEVRIYLYVPGYHDYMRRDYCNICANGTKTVSSFTLDVTDNLVISVKTSINDGFVAKCFITCSINYR